MSIMFVQGAILGLAFGCVFALIASGLTLIYAVTKHIHASHGVFMVLSMYMLWLLYNHFGIDPYLSLLIVVPAMFGIGLFLFRFVFRRVLSAETLTVFQYFIAWIFIIENALLIGFGADAVTVPSFITLSKLHFGSVIVRVPQLVAVVASLALLLALYRVIKATDFGRAIRAIAQDRDTASLMGINVRRIQMLVFGIGFALLAFAAVMTNPLVSFDPYYGFWLVLFALIILMLGGMGNFMGSLIAGLIIGFVYGMSYLLIGSTLSAIPTYVIVILILLFRPQGLLGTR